MVNKGLRDNVQFSRSEYGKKKSGYYPPSLEGYEYNPEYDRYMKKCKTYQVRNTKNRCVGRKSTGSGSGSGRSLAARAMKIHHRDKISLKDAWKRVRFGVPPPNLADYEINPLTGRYVKKCASGKVRNSVTGRCISDKTRSARVVNNNVPDDKEINPLTGRLVKKCAPGSIRNPSTGRCVKNSAPTPVPRTSTRFNGYKVEIIMKPEGVDEFIDLSGRDRAHNLTKLAIYYTDMAQILTRVYDIKNIKITKNVSEGTLKLKYDHANADEDEVDSGVQMVEDLGRDGRNPVQTNGNGKIIDIGPADMRANTFFLETSLSPMVSSVKKTKKGN